MTVSKSKLLHALNPEQRSAVTATKGPVLILAGAGSGKTRVITTRIAYLIGVERVAPSAILALTFTNKAAGEMRERVAALVGEDVARQTVLSTFHSFCVRVLRSEIDRLGYRKNFTIAGEGDSRTLLRRMMENLDGVRDTFSPALLRERISRSKSGGLVPGDDAEVSEETDTEAKYRKWMPAIHEMYQSALRAANSVDFDDLLLLTLRLWREFPEVLGRYQRQLQYVMVDEYQDTNRVQYDLLVALTSGHRNLCVVGDDDQSIYGWRGADIRNILSFERDFPETRVVRLERNYRSTQTILDAANAVIAHNRVRREKRLWTELPRGRHIDWFVTAGEEEEAAEAVSRVQFIRAKAAGRFADFAILYRSNLQSRPFEIALRHARIPYRVFGGQEFFERTEVKDILAYLRLIANPRDETAFLRVVNVPRRGIGDVTLHRVHDICLAAHVGFAEGLQRLLAGAELPPATHAGIESFLGILRVFRRRFREPGADLAEITADLLAEIGYRGEIGRTSKSPAQFEARWTNVEALTDSIAEYRSRAAAPTLTEFLDESALTSDEDRFERNRRNEDAVSLMTIHSAKGLEFPFVFIAGAEEGALPHEKSLGGGALEEERRLFYVAVTRAMRHLTLFEAVSRERYGRRRDAKTSRFLLEIPPELTEKKVRANHEPRT